MDQRLPVVSLFSGSGGLDLAIERCVRAPNAVDEASEPLRVAVALDREPDSVATLRKNLSAPVLQEDILATPTATILGQGGLSVGDPALVIGGPPCTPFSKSGFWLDYKKESRDPNASLLDEFARVVTEAQPETYVLENVYGLTYRTHAAQFRRLLDRLQAAGYSADWEVLNAADFGVPQLR